MKIFGSLIRFGAYEVDLESGELRKHGLKIEASGNPFKYWRSCWNGQGG